MVSLFVLTTMPLVEIPPKVDSEYWATDQQGQEHYLLETMMSPYWNDRKICNAN